MQYKWSALWITTVGTMMAGIDTRIVVIGLPTIAKQLSAGAEEVIWITQAYILAITICLLLIGRVSDLYGRVKLYNVGFVIFTLGSAFCSFSLNVYELILFRIVQGIGAALLGANSAAIITDAVPRNELGTMLGINQTSYRFGSIAGLTLSGLILSFFDWRWLFYINVPIGIIGTVWGYKKLREIAIMDTEKKLDWRGLALFSAGLIMILLAITYLSYGIGGTVEGIGLILVGLVLLAIFVKAESEIKSPLLDLRLFKIRLFAMGNIAQLLNALCWGIIVLIVALYLQIGLGYTPLQSGLAIIPLDLSYIASSLIGGKLSDRYGSRFLASSGLFVGSIGFLLMTIFDSSTSYPVVAATLIVIGIGNGIFIAPNIHDVMGSVPANRRGVASGFANVTFNIGFTLSYGLAFFFISLGIPYNSFTELLQGNVPIGLITSTRLAFFAGFRICAIALAIIEACAIIPSAMRGSRTIDLVEGA